MLRGSVEAFDRHPWFGALSEARRTALIRATRVQRWNDLEFVYRLGDPPDGLYAVANGVVRLYGRGRADAPALEAILGPGEWFGALSLLDGRPRPHDAVSSGRSSLLHLSMDAVRDLFAAAPGLHHDLVALVCQQFRTALAVRSGTAAAGSRQRLLNVLLGGAEALAAAPGSRPLAAALSQEDLAALAGVSRHTVHRILKSLQHDGVLDLQHGRLNVVDLEALRARTHAGAATPK